jgi:hypothetical protein
MKKSDKLRVVSLPYSQKGFEPKVTLSLGETLG